MTLQSDSQAHAAHKKRKVAKRATCANGLYIAPTSSQVVDSSAPFTIQWDNTCFDSNPTAVDIYLTAPNNTNTQVYTWLSVANSGTYSTTLKPSWWNSTSAIALQLAIIQSGTPSFLTDLPAGPVFTANYDASKAGTATTSATSSAATHDSPYEVVDNFFHGLSKGQIAVAVLLPLIAIFTAVGVYVWYARKKETKKRQRWSQAVDKRMSTISTDWKSMSGAAASHAIRHSMVGTGDRGSRASSFFAGNGPLPSAIGAAARPTSVFSNAGQAGVGRYNNGLGIGGNTEAMDSTDNMAAQLRRPPKEGAANPAARISRVSFAADAHPRYSTAGDSYQTRTSVYTQGTGARGSRAYHSFYAPDDGSVPPMPDLKLRDDMEMSPAMPTSASPMITMSPTQTHGPEPLSAQEIRSKIAAAAAEYDNSRPSVDEGLLKMPAMTLMRTSDASNDMVITAPPPTAPIDYPILAAQSPSAGYTSRGPSPAPAASAFGGLAPMHEASEMMSPDAMLKAYATQKAATAASAAPVQQQHTRSSVVAGLVLKRRQTSGEKVQAQTTSSANGGMRVLYAPTTPSVPSVSTGHDSAYDEESFVQPSANTHGYSDSLGASEEGVVTYGSRQTVVFPPALVISGGTLAGGLGPAGNAPEDTNPFRITSSYSDASRYSGLDEKR
ncbi:hypothetical protein FRB94_014473 [Tulasnella sp. JGI-2019a]|nr:hypothetical protein FRB93_008166 [Tulasnella sp. JGI-2019a]KAG8989333.1 hypothetical protein FRB94_014473 [Tulasnella sp. JGI-2019a]